MTSRDPNYWKRRYAENRDRLLAENAARRLLNAETRRESRSRAYHANKTDPLFLERKREKERAYHSLPHVKQKRRTYVQKNRDRINAWHRADRKKNPEKESAMQRAIYLRRREDPQFVVSMRVRSRMRASLIGGTRFGPRLEEALGYTMADLKQHLERQFKRGMSWDNKDEWHIDHIVPVSTFKYTSRADPDFKACWALSNLRPAWAKENRSKYSKRLFLI